LRGALSSQKSTCYEIHQKISVELALKGKKEIAPLNEGAHPKLSKVNLLRNSPQNVYRADFGVKQIKLK